ncbi:energy transducer TonB [Marivirga sp.]|uniref:energy transducer TonB n=1 Tax=Marivirga sp. TaxID=2018662 RepID=UPI003DA74946
MKVKYQYIDHLPVLSEKEIAQHRDFKAILDKRTDYLQRKITFRKKIWKAGISILILGAISTALFLWQKPFPKMKEIEAVQIQVTENAITKNEAFEMELPKAKRPDKLSQKQESIPQSPLRKVAGNKSEHEREIKEETHIKPSLQMGYERAVPIVGMDSLSNYLNKNLQYPEAVDKSNGIEGSVNVIFSITKEGEPSDIEIQNSLGEAFDEECFRLISNMPKWKPAIRNGKAVNSKVSLQLSFEIEKENVEK